jgi:hypothetical protein
MDERFIDKIFQLKTSSMKLNISPFILKLHPSVRVGISSASALIGYGAWAVWINGGWGSSIALRSGWAQGLYSAIITLILSSLVEGLVRHLMVWKRFLSILLPCLLLGVTSTTLHTLNGTPYPLLTLGPSYLLSCITIIVYVNILMTSSYDQPPVADQATSEK